MTADVPKPGSVEAAVAEVLTEHGLTEYARVEGIACVGCHFLGPTWAAGRVHQAEQLAAAHLLAAPVPAADADDATAERAPVGWMVLRTHPRTGHLIDDWDCVVHSTRQAGQDELAEAHAAGFTACGLYEVRAACRPSADDPRLDHGEAIGAFLIGHVRDNKMAWTCPCQYAGRIGDSYEHHRGDGIVALLARRGWTP